MLPPKDRVGILATGLGGVNLAKGVFRPPYSLVGFLFCQGGGKVSDPEDSPQISWCREGTQGHVAVTQRGPQD